MKTIFFSFYILIFLFQNKLSFAQNEDNSSVALFDQNNRCGVSKVQPSFLIVGGQEARPNSWPWSVAVFHLGRYICGASIIDDDTVLTAAHCVVRSSGTLPANEFYLVFGAHNLATPERSSFRRNVVQVKAHESYSPNGHHYDIALFKLAQPINFETENNVAPVCIPSSSEFRTLNKGTRVKLIGWGTTREGGRPSPTLRQVEVPIVDTASCARSYANILGPNNRIDNTQICAGYPNGGRDSCQGDSGGAMLYEKSGAYYQVGVVSFGKGCAQAGYPGVYTNVASFAPWVFRNL